MTKLSYIFVFIVFFSSVSSLVAARPLDRIIAVVNNDVVMESELQERVRTLRSQIRESGEQVPPTSLLEQQVLEQLVMIKLQMQLAENTGIQVDDEALNNAINEIAANNQLSLNRFRQILEQDGYDYETFRENIRQEMIISRLRQRQVDNRINVTDVEIDNYLATQKLQGSGEQEYRLSHILIALPEGISEAEKAERRLVAEQIISELEAGRNFAELAADISDGQQAPEGGDLGWRKKSLLPTLFSEPVANMEKGDISEIIENPSGFHIIELTDVRSGDKQFVTQTNARHILIRPDELNPEESIRARLEQLRQRIEGGDGFAELARSHSQDKVSAVDGGNLGWVSPGSLVNEFEEVMNSLQIDEVSAPFKTNFGWHIVQVLDRREHDSTDELRRAQAREAIHKRKVEEVGQNWLREMRDEAYVEFRLNE
ncbi:MAG: peptidylprolyl isomerase [Gammaproteobacteria bacterium]